MFELSLGVFLFLLAHLIPAYVVIRQKAVAAMGLKLYMSLYGISSLILFFWVIFAYQRAPYVEIWSTGPFLHVIALAIMALVCLLLACVLLQPNPFSLGRGAQGFDPHRPKIVGLSRHPAFVAFGLWACAHMLVKGDLAALIFFGSMAALSLYGPRSLDQKRQASLGAQNWQTLRDQVTLAHSLWGWRELGVGAVLFCLLVGLHEPILGVSPFWFAF